jgi:hypothetical protein
VIGRDSHLFAEIEALRRSSSASTVHTSSSRYVDRRSSSCPTDLILRDVLPCAGSMTCSMTGRLLSKPTGGRPVAAAERYWRARADPYLANNVQKKDRNVVLEAIRFDCTH